VTSHIPSGQADVDKLNDDLSEGLKTCRTMVANYRAMLVDGANDNRAARAESTFEHEHHAREA
jgi:hypothetical protein